MDGNPFKARKWCSCTRLTWDETQFLHLKPTEVVCMNFSVYFGPMLWRRGYRNMKFTTAWARDRRRAPHQPTSDVRPFGTSRDVQNCRMARDGRGRKCTAVGKLPLAWLCWCAFSSLMTHSLRNRYPIFTKQTVNGQAIRLGSCLAFLQHLTTGGQQIYFDYLIISWFSCFFAEKTLLGESKVCRSLWQSLDILDVGRAFWFEAVISWWTGDAGDSLPNFSFEADGESSGDIAIYLWVGASIWQKIWVVVNDRPAAFSYVFMFLLVIVISMKLHVGLW